MQECRNRAAHPSLPEASSLGGHSFRTEAASIPQGFENGELWVIKGWVIGYQCADYSFASVLRACKLFFFLTKLLEFDSFPLFSLTSGLSNLEFCVSLYRRGSRSGLIPRSLRLLSELHEQMAGGHELLQRSLQMWPGSEKPGVGSGTKPTFKWSCYNCSCCRFSKCLSGQSLPLIFSICLSQPWCKGRANQKVNQPRDWKWQDEFAETSIFRRFLSKLSNEISNLETQPGSGTFRSTEFARPGLLGIERSSPLCDVCLPSEGPYLQRTDIRPVSRGSSKWCRRQVAGWGSASSIPWNHLAW